jgi:hypothetical protein
MATWAKIKFYYDKMFGSSGSTLTATSTASGDYDVDYLYNMLETNMWMALNTATHYITYDAGVGSTRTADYIAVIGHNFYSGGGAGAMNIRVEYSSDNFSADINLAFNNTQPTSDDAFVIEFASQTARYWRVRTSNAGSSVYMTLCILGEKTELDYASSSFDPHAQNRKVNQNISYGGYVTGVHEQFVERSMSLSFQDADSTLYTKVKNWIDTNGVKNFFVAWDLANNPTEVFLMRAEGDVNNPLTNNGAYRNITINLKGRKE